MGIGYLVEQHWNDIEAEICLAEGGGVNRRGGQVRYALTQTAEKLPNAARLVAHGPAGHGSRPLRTNAILHLSRAIEKIAMWDPPMRFNDTTRYYFEKLATVSSSRGCGPLPRALRSGEIRRRRASTLPSTSRATTPCSTPRSRRTSSRRDFR